MNKLSVLKKIKTKRNNSTYRPSLLGLFNKDVSFSFCFSIIRETKTMDNVNQTSDEVLLEHLAFAGSVIEVQGREHPHVHYHNESCPKFRKSTAVRVG